ncbi:MAG: cytochrome c oxidase assembly protein [Alphaproteobacteria bacterium]|nr:cytochrome c oxidase assembly protein [Alphaproteobacteria bacterium]
MENLEPIGSANSPQLGGAPKNKQKLTVIISLSIVAVMLVASLASSPFYRAFCRATGFAGTPLRESDLSAQDRRDAKTGAVAAPRMMTMRFNGNVEPGLDWKFRPIENELKIAVGTNNMAYFEAENLTNHDITGVATFNVTPLKAAPYVVKVACFCFNLQTLAAGERVEMPILFYINPTIRTDRTLDEVTSITLSYNFYRASTQQPPKFKQTPL